MKQNNILGQLYKIRTLGKDRYPGQIKTIDVPLGLYDLAHDPSEKYDIKGLYPDLLKAIMVHVEEVRQDLSDDLTGHESANKRLPAKVH